jgi:hypothetical protein
MHGVAAQAAYVGLGVRRAEEVGMRGGVTAEAGLIHLLGGGCGQIEDLGLVAAGLDMRLARPMAALAGDAFAAMLQCQLGMRIGAELTRFLSVTGGAGAVCARRCNLEAWEARAMPMR